MKYQRPLRPAGASVLASTIAAVLGTGLSRGLAFAQEQLPQQQTLEEVTVTGTRIRRDGYTAPTPTTVVDSEYMQNLGLVNIADVVTQIPSNVSNFQPANTGGRAFFVGSTPPTLRGFYTC